MNENDKKNKLKFLLLNHVTYVKLYIDALLQNHYDSIIILDMLLSIQDQIGLFLKEYVG